MDNNYVQLYVGHFKRTIVDITITNYYRPMTHCFQVYVFTRV